MLQLAHYSLAFKYCIVFIAGIFVEIGNVTR